MGRGSLGQVLWECCDHEFGVGDFIGWLELLYLSGLMAVVCLFVLFRCCCFVTIVHSTVQQRWMRCKRFIMTISGKQSVVSPGQGSEEDTESLDTSSIIEHSPESMISSGPSCGDEK
jgi:hypothetical protein